MNASPTNPPVEPSPPDGCATKRTEVLTVSGLKYPVNRTREIIHVRDIGLPSLTSRTLSLEHVANIYRQLDERGFEESAGLLSVVKRLASSTDDISPWVIVDGMHRLTALKRFSNDPRFATLPVSVISNSPGKPPLDSTDVIVIAAHLNVTAHLIGKQSFADRVHMTTSYLQSLAMERAEDIENSSAENFRRLASAVEAAGFLDVQSAVRNRYIRISLSFVNAPSVSALFYRLSSTANLGKGACNADNMSVGTFSNAPAAKRCIMLQAMCRRFTNMKCPALKSPFDKRFFDFVDQLISQIEKVDDVHLSYHENGRYAEAIYKAATDWPLALLKNDAMIYLKEISERVAKFRTAVLGLVAEPDAVDVPAIPGPKRLPSAECLLKVGVASAAEESPSSAEPTALAEADTFSLDCAPAPIGRHDPVGSDAIPQSSISHPAPVLISDERMQEANYPQKDIGDVLRDSNEVAGDSREPSFTYRTRSTRSTLPPALPISKEKVPSKEFSKTLSQGARRRRFRAKNSSKPGKSSAVTQTDSDDDIGVLSGGDEDADLEADEPFDDRQQNPEPLSKVDPLVEACLPKSMLTTRARWYLSREVVSAVADTLAEIISNYTRKSFASFPATPHSGNIRSRFISPETSPAIYLSKAAQSLKTEGYVVLEDILLDSTISRDIDLVLNFFASKFGGVGVTTAGDPWSNIYNTGDQHADDRAKSSRLGRMTVPRKNLADDLEVNHLHIYQAKLRVELALALLLECLDESPDSLSFPSTGSRLLLTVGAGRNDCPRQHPHVDFALPDVSGAVPWTARPNPSYFLIASGAQSFPVHVWPFSHILSTGNDEVRLKAVSRAAHSLRVDVSAYSVFIGRGDLFHAGASGSETNTTSNPTNVRLHLYAARTGSRLLDAVHLPQHCDFRFHE